VEVVEVDIVVWVEALLFSFHFIGIINSVDALLGIIPVVKGVHHRYRQSPYTRSFLHSRYPTHSPNSQVYHLEEYLRSIAGGASVCMPKLMLSPRAVSPCIVFCISIHSESLGVTTFSATSYTYNFPSAPPIPTLRDKGVLSHLSLFNALSHTCVDTTGT